MQSGSRMEIKISKLDVESTPITEPKPKAPKPKPIKVPGEPKQPRVKRGPARPHRRLENDVINSRIEKLQKRLDRAKGQVEDASRHIEGYKREREFREKGE